MSARAKNYTFFIGTDVSRNKLDHAVMRGSELLFHRETANDQDAVRDFVMELKAIKGFTISKAVFCMENTGVYGNHLVAALRRFKANVVREPSVFIMRSQGAIRGKTDKLDSMRIAEYAFLRRDHLRLLAPRRPVVEELHQMNSMRTRLISYHKGLRVPMKEESSFLHKKLAKGNLALCTQSIAALKADCEQVDERMMELIESDESLKRLFEIIVSVPCVGAVTAAHIIVATNEFKSISDPKKFACYAGVAPFGKESGTKVGTRKRVSALANKKMKSLLHLCAIQAMRFCPELKDFYLRKVDQEGKPKMSVINALRYKLILRIFACVKQERKYDRMYINPLKERRSQIALEELARLESYEHPALYQEEMYAMEYNADLMEEGLGISKAESSLIADVANDKSIVLVDVADYEN